MLEKFVDVLMMDCSDHNQIVSALKTHAEEKTGILLKWVYETYTDKKEADQIADMIFSAVDAQQRCMLAKGIVIGLQLGIDCLTEEPSNSNQPS